MNFIGIDPGLQGGIAIISPERDELHPGGMAVKTTQDKIETLAMPVVSQGKKKAYNHPFLKKFFNFSQPSNFYAVLEEQHPMPVFRIEKGKTKKQGATSLFSIGYGFGALKQCLIDFSIPHEVIPAKDWQKEFGISGRKGNTKAQALQICQSLFPDLNLLATEKSKKPHEGIVDAILIAEFARRRYGGPQRNEKSEFPH